MAPKEGMYPDWFTANAYNAFSWDLGKGFLLPVEGIFRLMQSPTAPLLLGTPSVHNQRNCKWQPSSWQLSMTCLLQLDFKKIKICLYWLKM